MQQRYALRFENGERRGETIPVTGTGITIGRKPGNSVQILDASVSGRHAELVIDASGVLVRDLGSTNGTRVGNERVSEQRLAHADTVVFGNVRMTFMDTNLAEVPLSAEVKGELKPDLKEPTATVAGAEPAADAVRTVSAEKVARSRKSSMVATLVLLLALVAAGVGAWFWLQGRAGGGPVAQLKAVVPVDGNLIAEGYSFEGDETGWSADEGAPAAFAVDSAARRSGANGLQATLGAGEVALSRSGAVKVAQTRALTAHGWLRSDGDVAAALGIEFSTEGDSVARTTAWSASTAPGGDFEALELTSAVPAGYDSARVVVIGRAGPQGGAADADDVSLVAGGNATAPLALDEYQLFVLGNPATAAVLHKIDRALITALTVHSGGSALQARPLELNVTARDNGFSIACGEGAERTLTLQVESSLAQGGVASMGSGGYRTHNVEFAREAVSSLLFGAGKDLVHLKLETPANVRARPESNGYAVEIDLGANKTVEMQLAFRAERDEAQGLARSARNAEQQGQLGESLAQWAQLRDVYPFETNLLTEAETSRARLIEKGLNETRGLKQEVENARFFRLLDIFRACRTKAEQIAARYKGSEVEQEARTLAQQIDSDVAGLEADLDRTEAKRLAGIATALDLQKSPKLATRVRDYLAQRFPAPQGAAKPDSNGGGR
jgi:hypothetical protein